MTVSAPAGSKLRSAVSARLSLSSTGRERERGDADRDVDEEDPLPAGAVDEGTADQPRRRGADSAQRAPDAERLVPLPALREGGR